MEPTFIKQQNTIIALVVLKRIIVNNSWVNNFLISIFFFTIYKIFYSVLNNSLVHFSLEAIASINTISAHHYSISTNYQYNHGTKIFFFFCVHI